MTTYATIQLTCPNCRATLEVDSLRSTNYGPRTTDFHRLSGGWNPLDFMVHTCKACGFTGSEADFTGTISPDVSEKLREYVEPFVRDEQATPARRWEYASMIAEWRGFPAEEIAYHYLNAAWCSQEEAKSESEDIDQEAYYRRKAIEWFETAIDGRTATIPRPILTYWIGELYRRVGDRSMATTWFERVPQEAAGDQEYDWILELAKQQQTAPKEMIDEF